MTKDRCRHCLGALEKRREFTSLKGGVHVRYRCDECGCDGLVSRNLPGRSGVRHLGKVFQR